MRSSLTGLNRKLALCLASVMAFPLADSAPAQQGTPPAAQAPSNGKPAGAGSPTASLPEDPNVPAEPVPQSGNPPAPAPATNPGPQGSAPSPVGAAAAPVIRSSGIPASRPAGAAIAPAKQRRTRSYAIRVGLIVGAAVAIGAVTAASLSSSSRPH